MSFRKRNIPLTHQPTNASASAAQPPPKPPPPGTRPSPLDGRSTTSTGTPTLDALLGGHAGLPLGSSLLIEESGTTDFAGTLLRFYAAEGVVQGQQVHVVGVPEGWGRELPGVVWEGDGGRGDVGTGGTGDGKENEKMKIAWRYERLGQFGGGVRAPTPNRTPTPSTTTSTTPQQPFCHTFDLTKRLIPPSTSPQIQYHPIPPSPTSNPFPQLLTSLSTAISSSSSLPHRLLLPNLLSPLIYPSHLTHPHILLPFLRSLRALLRSHPSQLSILITLPLALYPRHTGLVRWIELLSDGLIELTPFPHTHYLPSSSSSSSSTTTTKGKEDEKPQGLLKVHRLPVLSERGQGVGAGGMGAEDMAFWVSRRRFVVKLFSLPPVEGDVEAQGQAEGGGVKGDIEF